MSLLFDAIEQLQDVVSISSDLPFSAIKPQLRAAQQFVTRFTGESLMERLTIKLENGEPFSTEEKALLERLRVPTANLALLRFSFVRNVTVNDIGVHRTETGQSKDAFQWQVLLMTRQLEADAWEGLEELNRYLEAKGDTFEEYTDSEVYKRDSLSLIRSAAVFSSYYFINDSRLTFYALQPAMRKAEERRIRPVLGNRLTQLLADEKADTLSEADASILANARIALVHATMARAIRERVVDVNEMGVQVKAISSFMVNTQEPATQKAIDMAVAYHETESVNALNDLGKVINPSPSTGAYVGSGVRGGSGLVGF